MDNGNLENIEPTSEPGLEDVISASEDKTLKLSPRVRKTPKPMVEGINAPVNIPASQQPMMQSSTFGAMAPKVTLTSQEQDLLGEKTSSLPASGFVQTSSAPKTVFDKIQNQKIILPSSQKKSWSGLIWAVLIGLLAVSTVLGVLFWYNSSMDSGESVFNLFPNKVDVQQPNVSQLADNQNPATAPVVPTSTPVIATSTPIVAVVSTPTTTPVVTPTGTRLKITSTPTGFLNVRTEPSTAGTLITKVYPGEVYTYTKTQSGWYNIALPDGKTGWVIGQYIEKAQ